MIFGTPCFVLCSDAQQKAAAAGAALDMDDLDVIDDSYADQLMLGTLRQFSPFIMLVAQRCVKLVVHVGTRNVEEARWKRARLLWA